MRRSTPRSRRKSALSPSARSGSKQQNRRDRAPPETDMGRATLIGFSAVAMWALLALLTDASG
ncbi:MAG: hypothetical protein E5Y69_27370, partial [Mesorhizobium sp.]